MPTFQAEGCGIIQNSSRTGIGVPTSQLCHGPMRPRRPFVRDTGVYYQAFPPQRSTRLSNTSQVLFGQNDVCYYLTHLIFFPNLFSHKWRPCTFGTSQSIQHSMLGIRMPGSFEMGRRILVSIWIIPSTRAAE